MTTDEERARQEIAERHNEPRLKDALLRVRAGYSIEEARTFFPTTVGDLEEAWEELQEEYTLGPDPPRHQYVHGSSLQYANPIDPTLGQALKAMHGPKLEDARHHPERYYAPTVLSLTWHEPVQGREQTAEKGFLMIHEIGGGAGYLIEGRAGEVCWTIGAKAFEKELVQIFQSGHWKIDYTTGEKIRELLKMTSLYEPNLAPRFDEDHDVRDYPADYEPAYHAEENWPEHLFEIYE